MRQMRNSCVKFMRQIHASDGAGTLEKPDKPGQTEMTLKGTHRSNAKRRASFSVISVCFTFPGTPTFPFDHSFSWQPATLVSTRAPQEAL
jgi:hypothetical protein